MKVALICPPLSLNPHDKIINPAPWYPLGPGYIAACLQREGHTVRMYDPDASGTPLETMWKELAGFGPDAAGFTATTLSFMVAKGMAQEAKRRLNCLVLMGGPHASVLPRSTLEGTPGLDAVIRGEGELPMLALAGMFDAQGKVDFGKVPGAAWLRDGRYAETPPPEPIRDLDSLPYPARDLLDMGPYERTASIYSGGKMATIISSRGCPSQCNFCSSVMGRRFRPRGAERVVDEMEHMVRKYGIKHFHIVDDCFSIDVKRAADICDLMVKRKLGVTWQASGRVNTLLDEELISKMKRSGCVNVLLGIETGNRRILELMRKGTTLEMARECCRKLHRQGIACYNSFILGAEGETWSTMLDTFIFSKRLPAVYSVFNIMTPFPGTPVFDKYYRDFDRPDTDWTDWASLFHARPYPPRHTKLSWGAQKSAMWTASLLYYLDPVQMGRILLSK